MWQTAEEQLSTGRLISQSGAAVEAGTVTGYQEADEMIRNRCAEQQDAWWTAETWLILSSNTDMRQEERAAEEQIVMNWTERQTICRTWIRYKRQ